MQTVGVIGGIGPESTIQYYRLIIAAYRARTRDGSYPPILINSIDLQKMLNLVAAERWPDLTTFLLLELRKLGQAGADFGVLAANTPHSVFDALRLESPIPLLSIVEVACEAARTRGWRRVGLFGTRFTMEARFYPDLFAQAGIAVIVPSPEEQTYIHEKYLSELVQGTFLPETRAELLAIAERLRARDAIEGLILGGTELPLILREVQAGGLPFLDTTQLHVDQIVARTLT